MINGKVHAWEDIAVYMNGVRIAGITEINFSDEAEREPIYGAGSKPIGVKRGNYKVEGDFTLTKEEADRFEAPARAAGKSVYDYKPFTIVVTYTDVTPDEKTPFVKREVNPLRTEVIKNVVIRSREMNHSQNEGVSVKYSFVAEEVAYG